MSRKRRSTKDTIGGSSVGTAATGDEDQSLDDVVDFSKMQINSRFHHLMNDSSSDIGGSATGDKKVSKHEIFSTKEFITFDFSKF